MNMSELIQSISARNTDLDLTNVEHLKLVKIIYGKYRVMKKKYEKMYRYYKGDTDAISNYKLITERSNLKINTNYLKKFIKEEVSYTIGNPITYESIKGIANAITDIEYYTSHWNELHDSDLMKYLLVFTNVYELYYLEETDYGVFDFSSKIIKPVDGYAYCDNKGRVLFFIHEFKNDFDQVEYIDIYTDNKVYHLNNKWKIVKGTDIHLWGEVPVTIGKLTFEGPDDSLYKDIKGLQDAFETNLSDIGNEISDFRNAMLKFTGCQLDESLVSKMKELGILTVKDSKASIDWLIKNINDTFIQNTLDRYEDTMYQIACHINHNERMQSNLSGVALRSRLIALENKCELEEKAHANMVKNRLRFLFKYLNITQNKIYDYKDIKIIYTPNIPQDDLSTAQMLSQIPDGIISNDTARGLFSFISNKVVEKEKIVEEAKEGINIIDDYSNNFKHIGDLNEE